MVKVMSYLKFKNNDRNNNNKNKYNGEYKFEEICNNTDYTKV